MYHQLFEEYTIVLLLGQYRRTGVANKLGLVESHLVYYEPVPTTITQIFRIVVHVSRRSTILSSLRVSSAAGNMGKYKTFYRITWDFSRLKCD